MTRKEKQRIVERFDFEIKMCQEEVERFTALIAAEKISNPSHYYAKERERNEARVSAFIDAKTLL